MATLDNPSAVTTKASTMDTAPPGVSSPAGIATSAVPPAGAQPPATTMRQRKRPDVDYTADDESGEDDQGKDKAEVTWGKTPSGVGKFLRPMHVPRYRRSHDQSSVCPRRTRG